MKLTRRNFLKLAGAAGAGALLGLKPLPASVPTLSQSPARAMLRLLGLTRSISVKAFARAATPISLSVQITSVEGGKAVAEGMDGYDLVITPAHILTDLIRRGQVREFEPLPALAALAIPQRAYDPLNAFSLPAGRGVVGMLSRGLTPPASWAEFFTLARTEPAYLPPAESFRAALKSLGQSINTRNAVARAQAKALISNLPSVSFSEARLAIG
ncbi:MAG TPA: twin-arginine translocation signal domain-containing protein, partial [Anaerolineales bacterium]|nr:twin-arginine translocation signal domain-containing protein [Anaerolineales bacterium]